MLLKIREIYLKFGIHPILNNINLIINPNEKISLIGRNGAGKSSLLKVIGGLIKPDSGKIESNPNIKIGLLEQEVKDNNTQSIFEIVASGLGSIGNIISQYHALILKANSGCLKSIELMQPVQEKIDASHAWGALNQIETIISKLNLNIELKFNELSGGLKRRVLLAKALVQQPDLLLLDEPTNHLDIESIKWLETFLINWKTSVLFISHDRAFVRNIATRIIELDRGELADWPGNYEIFLQKKLEYLNAEELANSRFDKKLANEEIWIRQGVKARRTRNEGRVLALEKMRALRAKRQDQPKNIKNNIKTIQEADKSGQKVIEAIHINHVFNNKTIINNFSTVIMRGDKIGIIGPNGCGKTTLLNILLGTLKPNSGTVDHGTNLEIAYFDQLRAILDNKLSVRDNLSAGSNTVTVNGKEKHVIGYLQDFLFTPERANGPITVLSGGEKNRLLLAKLFAKPSNLLILDEPTNDLDIETLELLEDLIISYTGTVLLISHDREFINNVVSSTIVFEEDGTIQEYVGGYDDWLSQSSQKNSNLPKKSYGKLNNYNNNNNNIQKNTKSLNLVLQEINILEKKQAVLSAKIAESDFYKQNKQTVDDANNELILVKQKLATLYKQWEDTEKK